MSNKIYLVFALLVLHLQSFAQKRDNIWMLGHNTNFHNYGIDFNAGTADTFSLTRYLNFTFTDVSICDTNGQMLFYSNGITILNRNNDTMQNTNGFNPGYYTTNYSSNGLPLYYSSVILPKPSEEQRYYYIFYESAEIVTYNTIQAAHPLNLSYSQIDISLDNGLGAIVPGKKNIHVINDTLAQGRIAAVKHGNGRDWWILCHRFNSNAYYRLLITPDSVKNVGIQNIGAFNPHYNYYGQATFSKDGNQYIIQIDDTTVDVYDFDRCSGLLSNSRTIFIRDYNAALIGCSFSPNGRYVYINNELLLRQYDTQAANIWSSEQLIATWDTFYSPGPTTFGTMKLAPDGKLYMGTSVGTNVIHVIQDPDNAGVGCNFVQNNFLTPSFCAFSLPNSPNWDLGPLLGSGCDSLIDYLPRKKELSFKILISPNPASEYIWIDYFLPISNKMILEIYNELGEEVYRQVLYWNNRRLLVHTNNLNEGIYFYKVLIDDKSFDTGKIVIVH